jgi:hypothetical protein
MASERWRFSSPVSGLKQNSRRDRKTVRKLESGVSIRQHRTVAAIRPRIWDAPVIIYATVAHKKLNFLTLNESFIQIFNVGDRGSAYRGGREKRAVDRGHFASSRAAQWR